MLKPRPDLHLNLQPFVCLAPIAVIAIDEVNTAVARPLGCQNVVVLIVKFMLDAAALIHLHEFVDTSDGTYHRAASSNVLHV